MSETIFALSSGALPAGIAVVRISGPQALSALERLVGSPPPPRTLALRILRAGDGSALDQAMVVRFDAPATATGEALAELHCHGGRAVIARILAELGTMDGLRPADPGEFTRRALTNGRLDLTRTEGLADLLAAETEWQRRAALDAASGGLGRRIEGWRTRLVTLAARAEAAIDYVDEEETELDLRELVAEARALADEWRRALSSPRSDLLRDGVSVVIAGPVNAGKSSLFNTLIEAEQAIVTPLPGTTRDLVEARLDLAGMPVRLIDTAGLRDSEDMVEQIGIKRAKAAADAADIILWLGDPAQAPPKARALLVHSRADERHEAIPGHAIPTSVVTGEGLDALRAALSQAVQDLLPPPDQATFNRQQAAVLGEALGWLDAVAPGDALIAAECLRAALHELDRLTGRAGTEDVLDSLFSRFCLGK